jgi:hypothetical protein
MPKPRHGFLYIYAECSRLCPHNLVERALVLLAVTKTV